MGNRNLKGLAVLLIVVLAIAGLAVIPAIAEEEEIAPTPAEGFIARVADHLGVSVEDLESAITAARIEAIEAGMITQEQADRIMERLGEGEGFPGRGRRGGRWGGFGACP